MNTETWQSLFIVLALAGVALSNLLWKRYLKRARTVITTMGLPGEGWTPVVKPGIFQPEDAETLQSGEIFLWRNESTNIECIVRAAWVLRNRKQKILTVAWEDVGGGPPKVPILSATHYVRLGMPPTGVPLLRVEDAM